MRKFYMICFAAACLFSAQVTAEPGKSYDAFVEQVLTSPRNGAALFTYLDHSMPQYWDDTGWDFNGVSRVPGEGEIACGYFVTTLLKDLGIPVERVRLAQAPSSVMIRELTVSRKTSNTLEDILAYIEAGPAYGIYIVGLDFHTGFISHSSEGTFFIHSNYLGREGVVREPAAASPALNASDFYMIGDLTGNIALIKQWAES